MFLTSTHKTFQLRAQVSRLIAQQENTLRLHVLSIRSLWHRTLREHAAGLFPLACWLWAWGAVPSILQNTTSWYLNMSSHQPSENYSDQESVLVSLEASVLVYNVQEDKKQELCTIWRCLPDKLTYGCCPYLVTSKNFIHGLRKLTWFVHKLKPKNPIWVSEKDMWISQESNLPYTEVHQICNMHTVICNLKSIHTNYDTFFLIKNNCHTRVLCNIWEPCGTNKSAICKS